MSSPPTSVGDVDLEAVLNVRRRTLASISEKRPPYQQYRYTDTVYVKREDSSNSIFSIDSKILLLGELQLLCSIFERYSSNLIVNEDSNEQTKTSFSNTFEEIDEENPDSSAITSTLQKTSISSNEASSPPKGSGTPFRHKTLGAIGRSQTTTSTASEYSAQNLEGKRYGSIEIPHMTIIEIFELLTRNGLELVNESNDYDKENVLHQNFIFSKVHHTPQKTTTPLSYSRTSSLVSS